LESCIKATVNVTMFLTWLKHLRHNHCSHIKLCFCYTHNSTREACVQNKHISYTDLYRETYIVVILHQLKTRFNTASVLFQSGLSYLLHEEKSSERSRGPRQDRSTLWSSVVERDLAD